MAEQVAGLAVERLAEPGQGAEPDRPARGTGWRAVPLPRLRNGSPRRAQSGFGRATRRRRTATSCRSTRISTSLEGRCELAAPASRTTGPSAGRGGGRARVPRLEGQIRWSARVSGTSQAHYLQQIRSPFVTLAFRLPGQLGLSGQLTSAAPASVLIKAAIAGSRRSFSRQRLRLGPMLPTGMPSLALI